jgi:predicted O-methyltransferase YrrM
VSRRLPDNLARLYDTFGIDAETPFSLLPGDSFVVDGVEFVCDYQPGSTADRFFIVKPLPHVERYLALFEEHKGAAIFELGIAEGGSTALAALVAEPRKLVAVDLEPQRLEALDELVERRGLSDTVRTYWGVDQSDRARLVEIVEEEFGGEPLDLVIDDASHQLAPTRASFEALFPCLRAGGLYIIEDWNSDHVFYDAVGEALRDPSLPGHEERMQRIREAMASKTPKQAARPEPLSNLVVELLLARASSVGAIEELTLGEFSVVVRRGPGELDPRTFGVRDLYRDHFGLDPSRRPVS